MLLIEMFTDERERLAVTRSSQSVFVPFLNNHISCEIVPYIAWRYIVIHITCNVIERCSLEWSTGNSYLWFCNITPSDWRKKLAPLCYPIRSKPNQSWLACSHFAELFVDYTCLFWVLIGSPDCLCPLWLSRVIMNTLVLVLVLWQSYENCFINDFYLI